MTILPKKKIVLLGMMSQDSRGGTRLGRRCTTWWGFSGWATMFITLRRTRRTPVDVH